MEESVARLLHRLQTIGEREVTGRFIGDMVMEALRGLDQVAYVRYASVYRSFQDIADFREEVERLQSLPLIDREQMSLLPDDDQ